MYTLNHSTTRNANDTRNRIHPSGEHTVLSSHTSAANAILYDPATKTLVSASWDSTLHIHHPYTPGEEPATLTLPSKPFALSLSPTKLVVAMSSRAVHIYDLPAISLISSQAGQPPPNAISVEPFQRRESSLKFMTRAVACMPRDEGFACSSIEGRVAVEWFDASAESQARKYAFKCHRQPASSTQQQQNGINGAGDGGEQSLDIVYPVHALAFHPVHGTFASGGGDGVVTLWDAVAKRRIRQYQQYATSVAAMSFSQDGKFLAVAVSPGFEDGGEGGGEDDDMGGKVPEGPVKLFVRELGPTEAKGKGSGK